MCVKRCVISISVAEAEPRFAGCPCHCRVCVDICGRIDDARAGVGGVFVGVDCGLWSVVLWTVVALKLLMLFELQDDMTVRERSCDALCVIIIC